MTRTHRRSGRERGSSSLELLGVIPIVLLVAFAVLQVIAAVYTVSAANQAVRDGARAYGLHGAGAVSAAIEDSLPGLVELDRPWSPWDDDGVRIVVDVPRLAPFMPEMHVTRTAVMP